MLDVALIMISALLLYIIGYPLVEWFNRIKDEMEEEKDGSLK